MKWRGGPNVKLAGHLIVPGPDGVEPILLPAIWPGGRGALPAKGGGLEKLGESASRLDDVDDEEETTVRLRQSILIEKQLIGLVRDAGLLEPEPPLLHEDSEAEDEEGVEAELRKLAPLLTCGESVVLDSDRSSCAQSAVPSSSEGAATERRSDAFDIGDTSATALARAVDSGSASQAAAAAAASLSQPAPLHAVAARKRPLSWTARDAALELAMSTKMWFADTPIPPGSDPAAAGVSALTVKSSTSKSETPSASSSLLGYLPMSAVSVASSKEVHQRRRFWEDVMNVYVAVMIIVSFSLCACHTQDLAFHPDPRATPTVDENAVCTRFFLSTVSESSYFDSTSEISFPRPP